MLLRLLWPHWNGRAISYRLLSSLGCPVRSITEALRWAERSSLIVCTAEPSRLLHRCAAFTITPETRVAVYADAPLMLDFNEWERTAHAPQRRPRRPTLAGISDPRVAELLSRAHFTWDGARALHLIGDLDREDRASAWATACLLPAAPRPSWRQATEGRDKGRLYTHGPNLQGIKGALRPALGPGADLWEVDIRAAHLNTVRIMQGLEPSSTAWDDGCELAGTDKRTFKGIANARFYGQRFDGWAHGERNDGREPDRALYDCCITALHAVSGLPFSDDFDDLALMEWGATILHDTLSDLADDPPEMLLPLHDGLLIGGTERDADRARAVLHERSKMPVEKRLLSPPDAPVKRFCETPMKR